MLILQTVFRHLQFCQQHLLREFDQLPKSLSRAILLQKRNIYVPCSEVYVRTLPYTYKENLAREDLFHLTHIGQP